MNATKQPFDVFAMIETAKRIMSTQTVVIQADNVVISRRFRDDDEFEAIKFAADGSVTKGWWNPNRDWQYPEDITTGEAGTFTPHID